LSGILGLPECFGVTSGALAKLVHRVGVDTASLAVPKPLAEAGWDAGSTRRAIDRGFHAFAGHRRLSELPKQHCGFNEGCHWPTLFRVLRMIFRHLGTPSWSSDTRRSGGSDG
jgi:hypothetical protein